MTTAALSPAEVRALPASVTALQAFAAINVGTTFGYHLLAQGEFPIQGTKVGRTWRFRRGDVLAFLGLDEDPGGAEVESAPLAGNDDAPGVEPGAPVEPATPTSK
ncbi:hypothetical protein ABTX35_02955 [Streptomyces sp. NPDC096080]|uniref:helix-turn-helix domain-containing protein n=1 Tax=Streptomyces sp. NPDC096080 TaxID=3156693 RepID=UPI003321C925